MCLTYGRPDRLLGEAVESFLRQDYAGRRELVILNDWDKKTIVFNHPEVVVVNTSKRFKTIGEKRNACAALCSHDLLFVWDDDDLYLPHRLTFTVQKMLSRNRFSRFYKPNRAFTLNSGVIRGPIHNLFHSGSAWTRDFFDEVGGYPHMNSGQDGALERRFKAGDPKHKRNQRRIRPDEIYYIYRWRGTHSFHLSGFGKDQEGEETGSDKVARWVRRRFALGQITEGIVNLEPAWTTDYVSMVDKYVERLRIESPDLFHR